jgi:probable rRNA maturation factor
MPSQQSSLLFQVATPGVSRRDLRAFLKRLEAEVADGRVFCCLIAGDAELRRLNREFRKRDYPTDVLSFPLQKHPLPDGRGSVAVSDQCIAPCGEIAISYDTALRQSGEFGHDVKQEIEILMLHGLLHLLGMDHETDGGRMLSAERKWRIRLGLPAGLIERVSA